MKKIVVFFLLAISCLLTACGKKEEVVKQPDKLGNNEIYIYYVDETQTDIWPVPCKVNQKDDLGKIAESILNQLKTVEDGETYASAIPEDIRFKKCKRGKRKGNIELYFAISYDNIDADDLLFFKSCVVKSFLNLDEFRTVTIFLTDVHNPDEETATVSEKFDQDSFSIAFGEDSPYQQRGAITVYFASESGKSLKEYRKTVEITNTTSLARLVVETLIAGPNDENYTATIPSGTTIRNLSVKDGICYVDLSDEFYSVENPLKNDIIIYSIVNSLAELPTVSKVQFLKNGEKLDFYRETLPFDGTFERNLDLISEDEIK